MFPVEDMETATFVEYAKSLGFTQAELVESVATIGTDNPVIPKLLEFWRKAVCPYVREHYDYGKKSALFEYQSQLLMQWHLRKDQAASQLLQQMCTSEEWENTQNLLCFESTQ